MDVDLNTDVRFTAQIYPNKVVQQLIRVCLCTLGIFIRDELDAENGNIAVNLSSNNNDVGNCDISGFQAETSLGNDEQRSGLQETTKLLTRLESDHYKNSSGRRCEPSKCRLFAEIFLRLLISLVLIVMVWDLIAYLQCLWGRPNDIIFLVTYFTYIPQLAVPPLISCWIFLEERINPTLADSTACIFRNNFLHGITKFAKNRTVFIDITHLLLVLVWPVTNVVIIIYVWATIEYEYSPVPWHMFVSRLVATIGFLQYGCLCYPCFKLREGFTSRFHHLAKTLGNRDENDEKSEICEVYLRYKDFRDFVGYWMTFTISIGMMGLAAFVSWNYGYYKENPYKTMDDDMFIYSIMILNQKLMFIFQPLLVFKGINVNYMWSDFKECITEYLMAPKTAGQTFHYFMRHMNEVNHAPEWMITTLVFSLVGLYFGMKLEDQNYEYWVGPDCHKYNDTTVDPMNITYP